MNLIRRLKNKGNFYVSSNSFEILCIISIRIIKVLCGTVTKFILTQFSYQRIQSVKFFLSQLNVPATGSLNHRCINN